MTLGRLDSAVADARRGIDFADELKDDWQMFLATRATAADALHQSGDRDEARELFAAAERMQKERAPQFELRYSLAGFRYCDLLLATAERAAWQVALASRGREPAGLFSGSPTGSRPRLAKVEQQPHTVLTDAERTTALDACTQAERRAATVFEWRAGTIWNPNADSVLSVALDNLTLARATFYAWLLRADSAFSLPPSSFEPLSVSVHSFRKAGTTHELPKGLLTVAVWHACCGKRSPAVEALNEALQIAQRGPMPLYYADILLTRARLFSTSDASVGPVPTGQPPTEAGSANDGNESAGGNRPYPWDSSPQEDLREARRLIEKHGYWRRKEELEDAEIAIFGAIQA